MQTMEDGDSRQVWTDSTASDPTSDSSALWSRATAAFLAWRRGDAGGVDELVRTMTPVLWNVVRAYGLTQDLAQDVIQSTWLILIRRADTIADPHAVAAWLTTTARREAWRAASGGTRSITVSDDDLEYLSENAPSAEERAVADDGDSLLWECVHTLSERCQRLLRIVAFDERPDYARVAQELSMPVGSIGPTRGRCLAKLRAVLTLKGGVA
jgi:RNA polymerase sigma factor (sigma-70 family)